MINGRHVKVFYSVLCLIECMLKYLLCFVLMVGMLKNLFVFCVNEGMLKYLLAVFCVNGMHVKVFNCILC